MRGRPEQAKRVEGRQIFLALGILLANLFLPPLLFPAETKLARQAEWEKTVQAAEQEGQTIFQKIMSQPGDPRDSRRIDVPKDHIPPEERRKDGMRYFDIDDLATTALPESDSIPQLPSALQSQISSIPLPKEDGCASPPPTGCF